MYYVVQPRFETGDERYAWVDRDRLDRRGSPGARRSGVHPVRSAQMSPAVPAGIAPRPARTARSVPTSTVVVLPGAEGDTAAAWALVRSGAQPVRCPSWCSHAGRRGGAATGWRTTWLLWGTGLRPARHAVAADRRRALVRWSDRTSLGRRPPRPGARPGPGGRDAAPGGRPPGDRPRHARLGRGSGPDACARPDGVAERAAARRAAPPVPRVPIRGQDPADRPPRSHRAGWPARPDGRPREFGLRAHLGHLATTDGRGPRLPALGNRGPIAPTSTSATPNSWRAPSASPTVAGHCARQCRRSSRRSGRGPRPPPAGARPTGRRFRRPARTQRCTSSPRERGAPGAGDEVRRVPTGLAPEPSAHACRDATESVTGGRAPRRGACSA